MVTPYNSVAVSGQMYTLICNVSVSESLGSNITYVWRRRGIVMEKEIAMVYHFTAMAEDDQVTYNCTAMVHSRLLIAPIVGSGIRIINVLGELQLAIFVLATLKVINFQPPMQILLF